MTLTTVAIPVDSIFQHQVLTSADRILTLRIELGTVLTKLTWYVDMERIDKAGAYILI